MSAVGKCNCMVVFLCRYVHMLSTYHIAELGDGLLPTCVRKDGRKKVDVPCPPMLPDYVKNMRGVDRGDQMISLYNAGRKSMKVRCLFPSLRSCLHIVLSQGWKAILWYLLECAMLNSFIVEGEFDERHRGTGRRRDYLAFRKDLANCLIDGFSSRKEVSARNLQVDRLNTFLRHLPQFVSENRECVLCTRRGERHHSNVKCTSCERHLCVARDRNCFKRFHITRDL